MQAPSKKPPAIFLMGPTASGKTDIAVELVRRLPCEIISVDSAMVYRGMDIGTAKPEPEILAEAPHRLIGIADPTETYSAARFREEALKEMADITGTGRVPLLVGGTGLYFRALERGLSPLPPANPKLRKQLAAEAAEQGLEALHERLKKADPASAARINRNDPQRIQRALEVLELTGQPMGELLAEENRPALPYRIQKLILTPGERETLHARIAQRFHTMLEQGFITEVEGLRTRGDLHADLPSMRAVGYRQIWRYLDSAYDYQEMENRGIIATRQLAKRQLTWLRAEDKARRITSSGANRVDEILKYLITTIDFG